MLPGPAFLLPFLPNHAMDTTRAEATELAPHQLRVTEVRPVAAPGALHLRVALAHWLVAVVRVPVGPGAVVSAFPVGAVWPPVAFPPGCVLLGYLDARDLTLT